jgi:hypothetical protein
MVPSGNVFGVTPWRASATAEPVSTPHCTGLPFSSTGWPLASSSWKMSWAWLAPGM